MNTEALNAVKNLIVDFANSNGICLITQFRTQDNFKKFVISLCFTELVKSGIRTETAFDFLLGDGAFNQMANDCWHAMQSR